jgi:hypothetical protein
MGAMTRVPVMRTSKPFEQAHRQQLRDTSSRLAGGFGVAWQGLTHLNSTLLKLERDTDDALAAAGKDLGEQMVAYAKQNAPWEDRTTDARENLHYDITYERDGSMSVWLAHGGGGAGKRDTKEVPYGIWLEVRWGGKYAIILPTIDHFRGQIGGITADHMRAHVV